MAQITYLVQAKQNVHGDFEPNNLSNCMFYKDNGVKSICWSEEKMCEGIKGGNIVKELGNMKFLLECKYGQ